MLDTSMNICHSDIKTTMNIYTHVMPEEKLKAVDKRSMNYFNFEFYCTTTARKTLYFYAKQKPLNIVIH